MKKYKVRISRGGSAGYVEVLARTQREAMDVAEAQNPGARAINAQLVLGGN
jgi:hypothetical protein